LLLHSGTSLLRQCHAEVRDKNFYPAEGNNEKILADEIFVRRVFFASVCASPALIIFEALEKI
jgi:hypothetical protein